MKIKKFTDKEIELTLEEVSESKLIDKKFISENPKRVFVELSAKNGYEFRGNLEELKDFMKEMLSGLPKDERDFIVNSII